RSPPTSSPNRWRSSASSTSRRRMARKASSSDATPRPARRFDDRTPAARIRENPMPHGFDLLYVLSGFCVGALVGMTGGGGGSLMTPVLILVFGVHPATAVGTDLLYAAITKTGGIAIHTIHRTIDWKVVGRLATGSVPAALFTILALSRADLTGGGARTLIND